VAADSTEATETLVPARRSTSMVMAASIGSVPFAIGTRTYSAVDRGLEKDETPASVGKK
jgi:hypothetical protein